MISRVWVFFLIKRGFSFTLTAKLLHFFLFQTCYAPIQNFFPWVGGGFRWITMLISNEGSGSIIVFSVILLCKLTLIYKYLNFPGAEFTHTHTHTPYRSAHANDVQAFLICFDLNATNSNFNLRGSKQATSISE